MSRWKRGSEHTHTHSRTHTCKKSHTRTQTRAHTSLLSSHLHFQASPFVPLSLSQNVLSLSSFLSLSHPLSQHPSLSLSLIAGVLFFARLSYFVSSLGFCHFAWFVAPNRKPGKKLRWPKNRKRPKRSQKRLQAKIFKLRRQKEFFRKIQRSEHLSQFCEQR